MAAKLGKMSPLRKDLALSDVRLAAVKVLSGNPITAEQVDAARLLCQALTAELAVIESAGEVPEAAVPGEETRRQIASMLKNLPGSHFDEPGLTRDPATLRQLLDVLQPLSEGELTTAQAEQLLQVLHDLTAMASETPQPTALSYLGERV